MIMLQSYQARLVNGSLTWLGDMPELDNIEVIVTILPKQHQNTLVGKNVKHLKF